MSKQDLQCKASVADRGGWRHHQCSRKAWKDGWCKIHHPDVVKEKSDVKRDQWRRESRIHFINLELRRLGWESISVLREILPVAGDKAKAIIDKVDALEYEKKMLTDGEKARE